VLQRSKSLPVPLINVYTALWPGQSPMTDHCEHGKEPLGSIKGRIFDSLHKYYLLKNCSMELNTTLHCYGIYLN
jgi:hypothetical protein